MMGLEPTTFCMASEPRLRHAPPSVDDFARSSRIDARGGTGFRHLPRRLVSDRFPDFASSPIRSRSLVPGTGSTLGGDSTNSAAPEASAVVAIRLRRIGG